jgi:hypothetical protein
MEYTTETTNWIMFGMVVLVLIFAVIDNRRNFGG